MLKLHANLPGTTGVASGLRRAALAAAAGLALTAAPATAATVFSNTAEITIPDVGAATPYPSSITVSGLLGLITDLEVALNGFSHAFPSDVGMLLVGPGGQTSELMGFGTEYPSPAPVGPYGTALSVFDGTDPNGVWQLFVFDAQSPDGGSVSGGWSLSLTTDAPPPPGVVPLPAGAVLLLSGLGLLALRRRA